MADKQTFSKPKASSKMAQTELDRVEKQFQEFDESAKSLTLDHMNKAPVLETEQQTKLSQAEIQKKNSHYLKPKRSISDKARFNETYRADWEYAKEYVNFIAEHKEIIGDNIEMWTHPFAGVAAEYWEIPTNKPIWAPRYVAAQLKRCNYHRLRTEDSISTGGSGTETFYGGLVVDNTIQRLDAHPVQEKKTFMMGASGF